MSESPTSSPQNSSSTAAIRVAWTVLILATLYVCYFSHLGAIGFVGPDEPRYAWIARAMTETGDWVTPRLYGQPWFEKPPLFYWGAALSFKLFGVSEAAARLPSAISALLATLALAWLALRMCGAETARWLLLLLPTTVGMIGFSHAAATDMPFSGMLTIAMVCAAVALRIVPSSQTDAARITSSGAFEWLALILFGFFLGLAVLAKGPAGIILCGGAVFFWAIFTKRWRDAFRLFHPAAIASFCITALPWYVLCARRNPDFFRIFIVEHNFKRYLTPEFQHIQPFWYYGAVLLAALFPWTILLVWRAISGSIELWRKRNPNAFSLFLLCWAAFTILFFTISKSKLPGYILPALPAIALLIAHPFTRFLEQRNFSRWWLFATGLTFIVVGLLGKHFSNAIPFGADIRPAPIVGTFALITLVGGVIVCLLALFLRPVASAVATVVCVLALLTLDASEIGMLDAGISARPVVTVALQRMTSADIAAATTYKLRRAYKYQVDFYLHREAQEWTPLLLQHSIIFTNYKEMPELERLGVHCPKYLAAPAVVICENRNGGPALIPSPANSRKTQ